MRNLFNLIFFLFILFAVTDFSQAQNKGESQNWLNFSPSSFSIPDIPISKGINGAFTGIDNNVLIVAGGSYWDGDQEVYLDSIFVCVKNGEDYQWKFAGKLPYPVAHGATVQTSSGLLCIGGENTSQKYDNVFMLHWDATNQTVVIDKKYPSLPIASSYIAASVIGNSVFVNGGKIQSDGVEAVSDNFWELDLMDLSRSEWKKREPVPGGGRFGASLVRQSNGDYDCLFLFGGKSERSYLADAYMFDPKSREDNPSWEKLADMPRPAMDAPALAVGGFQVFIFGGSGRHNVEKISEYTKDFHFTTEILSYNTITNVWHTAGELPHGVVNTTALMWDGGIVLPGGKIRRGVSTPEVITASLNPSKQDNFTSLDYILLFVYLALIILLGSSFSSKNRSSKDYFLAGQKIPFWAAGLSMMATQVSSIGFMAIPAKSFATNWAYFAGVLTWFVVIPIVIIAFVPFYRRLNVTSVYEYLEKRFNNSVRLFFSGFYLLFQLLGRLGVMIFLPAIALSAVTGIDAIVCVLIIGCLATAYTILGGMYAVVWTDLIQAIVLFGGVFLMIFYVLLNTGDGIIELTNIAWNDRKFSFGSMDLNLTKAVFWVVIVGNIFNRLGTMSTDQSVVQRYLTTRDEKETKKALWADVGFSIPWALAVFILGTALYVFYKVNPGLIDPTLENDAIVPFFIGQHIPPGISGIVIGGIFAASMSSVDSSIHSSTTVLLQDFFHLRISSKSELRKVSLARWITGVLGLMGTIIAVGMTFLDIVSVWDIVLEIMSLFVGVMTGVFLLGIFSNRGNAKGVAIGAITSMIILFLVKGFLPLHFFLYSGIGIISCVSIGYLASLFFTSSKNIKGLTIYSILKK